MESDTGVNCLNEVSHEGGTHMIKQTLYSAPIIKLIPPPLSQIVLSPRRETHAYGKDFLYILKKLVQIYTPKNKEV